MFGYILIRQNRLKTKQQMIILQQKLFRSQMNPHFIFNSLTSIQGFITEKDPRSANIYLSRFAKLIRNILDSSVNEFIPLEDGIATIENYLELQKVRYEGKFDYNIVVDEKIDKEKLSDVYPSATIIGELKQALTFECGIKGKTAIVTGGHDQICGAIGGAIIKKGSAIYGLGSVECITPVFDKPLINKVMFENSYACVPYGIDGKYATYGFNFSGGSLVKWFA